MKICGAKIKILTISLFVLTSFFCFTKTSLAQLCTSALPAQLESDMTAILNAAALDPAITSDSNFSVLLEDKNGNAFTYSHGASLPTMPYESASTSKLPSAVIILTLIDQGFLTLDSKPHDLIGFWTGESSVTLRHLLNFTSGFNNECAGGVPTCALSCLNVGVANFINCVQNIYNNNIGIQPMAGTQFYYSGTHLQIAGLMAVNATGKSWSDIFSDFQAQTGLFLNSTYNKPSAINPRLAGGMTWIANDYQDFLHALYWNKRPKDGNPLLSPAMWN